MCHLNLDKRVQLIQQDYGVTVKRSKLRDFYRRNNIRNRPTYIKYYPHNKCLETLEMQRMEFAADLATELADNRRVLYFDETTFNSQMVQKRAWFTRD